MLIWSNSRLQWQICSSHASKAKQNLCFGFFCVYSLTLSIRAWHARVHWCSLLSQRGHLALLPINSNLSESLHKRRAENRGSDAASQRRGWLERIKALPWVGGKGLGTHPQCSAAGWNNANQALITTSLARGFPISRNYTRCKFSNKRPHNYTLISPHIRFHER